MASGHIFILGGTRSGKTTLAERLALRLGNSPAYLATAEVRDDEMRARVAMHRNIRGDNFVTIEERLLLPDALEAAAQRHDTVLVDCLTLWLSNLMEAGRDIAAETAALTMRIKAIDTARIILVTNEVGLGIVPENALARAFRDHAGTLHQAVAAEASHAYFVVAGLPLVLKGTAPDNLN